MFGIGLSGIGLAGAAKGGGPYDPAALALFARMTTPPTDARKVLINAVFAAGRRDGWLSKLDGLKVRAAADSQAARLNWVADQYNCSAISSPVFTVDRGYTPDGAASYLDQGFNPTTAVGAQFLLDNAHQGAWHLTDLANAGAISFDFGNVTSRFSNSAVAATIIRANSTAAATATDNYNAHKVWTRDAAASWRYYNSGVISGADPRTDLSTALTSFNFGTGRTAAASFGLNQEAVSHWGGHLTTVQVASMYAALASYLTAVGAI